MIASCSNPSSDVSISRLRCEYLENPIGLDALNPRLSWNLESNIRNQSQVAYQILVASSPELLISDSGDAWNSGKVNSINSLNIPYNGIDLGSARKYYWKVRIWDKDSLVSPWSETGHWFMGLLDSSEWKAQWIGYDTPRKGSTIEPKPWGNNMKLKSDYLPQPCSYMRYEFSLDQPIIESHAFITALGNYELHINGRRVGEKYFTPGWTDYTKRIYYNAYDVAELLLPGKNAIAVVLADGWYAGNVADRGQNFYGDKPKVKAQIQVSFVDGSNSVITTNSDWKASTGPIIESDMQAGETYDARLELDGWTSVGYTDSNWSSVNMSKSSLAVLESYPGQSVQKQQELMPSEISQLSNGSYLVKFGQNFAGWVKLNIRGEEGDSIIIKYAEKLTDNGNLYTRNLRSARVTDTYVVGSSKNQTWEPSFTYHGFQYVEVSGYPGILTKGDIVGVVVHSNLESTGKFSCSDSMINRLNQNIIWSQRSNYFEVPTDCPQRDERMGWTGDAQVFMQTAAYNMNIAPFYTKWMVDVADGQYENGRFPSTAPRVYNRVAAGWGDAGVICPWYMYQLYQDTLMLRKYYPNMVRWMDHLADRSPNFISTLGSYGDWQNVESETPTKMISTAYFKHCADLMVKMASILNHEDDSTKYSVLGVSIKTAFSDSFLLDSAKLKSETQTAYLLALNFSLIPIELEEQAFENLVATIYKADTSLTTGILGTHLLLPVLTEYGRLDLAYRLLLNDRYPSWGHQIKNGATTIWERWNSYSDYQGFHEDSTNSLNHYAYGAVGEWLYATIAGIQQTAPGYKEILIYPRPGGGLSHAKADYLSPTGLISSHWKILKNEFALDVKVPVNTTAWVVFDSKDLDSIQESGKPASKVSGVIKIAKLNDKVWIQVGSGEYHFKAPYLL